MSVSSDAGPHHARSPVTMPSRVPAGTGLFADQTAERRVVTILFCDVVSSSAMAELLDPEEWAEVMSEAFEFLIRPIERYDGTVTRLMGDAVLALFGAPHAHEDDPLRAILAGLEIVEGIQPLSERIRRRHGFAFNVRVGINTGLVVVGAFGADDFVEYTAMGDAINVAARLQEMAAPGTVLVGAATHRFASCAFDFEPFGESDVRGKQEPEETYRVIGRRSSPASPSEAANREMPFTGRAAELNRIKAAIDDLRFNGRGSIIAICGEAGIGKTRLVEEVARYARTLPDDGGMSISLLENRVNPYEAKRPYAGLQARLRRVFGIDENDSSQVVREKFIQQTMQFPEEFRERAAQVIQRVMALDIEELAGGREIAGFEPEEFKAELATVVMQIVRGWNPDGAFMLLGEDYQWGDAASLEIVSHLYQLLRERPVLFLCTYRPDQEAPMTRILDLARQEYADYLIEINLTPLAAGDTETLVGSLIAGDSPAAESLRRFILSRSEGNPLFIEEIIQSLVDQGALERSDDSRTRWKMTSQAIGLQISIPASLQALLLERIDRLPADARRTLQQASVLGRNFSRRVLRDITRINGNLDSHIETLLQLDLIRRREGNPDDSLTFRHALIQEAAYNTILLRHRREFHRRAAESIEHIYADRQQEYASDIGLHYFQAEDGRGVEWLIRAARHAESVYESEAVVDYASKAIELADAVEEEQTRLASTIEARQLRGRAHDLLGNFEQAHDDLQAILQTARRQSDREWEWTALLALGQLWSASDYSMAGRYIQEALELARNLGDNSKLAHSLNRSGNWHINLGNPADALRAHEEALAIFKQIGDEGGIAETLDLLGMANYMSGDFTASATSFRQAIPMFRSRGDNRGLSSSLTMLAMSGGGFDAETALPAAGSYEEWSAHASEALEIARSIRWRAGEAFAQVVVANVNAVHGELGEAIEAANAALAIAREIDHKQWILAAMQALDAIALELFNEEFACRHLTETLERARDLGSAYWIDTAVATNVDCALAAGRLNAAAELLDEAFDPGSPLDAVGQRKLWHRRAKLLLAIGDADGALQLLDRLIDTAPPSSVESPPNLALLRGDALSRLGYLDEAIRELTAGRDYTARTNDRLHRFRLHLALAEVYRQTGRSPESIRLAEEEIDQARTLIDEISERLPGGDWRSRFLAGANELLVG